MERAFGLAAAAVTMAGYTWYIVTMFRGPEADRSRPLRAAWLIWAVEYAAIHFAQQQQAARESLWLSAAQTIGVVVIFSLSIWRGTGRIDRNTILILALVGGGLLAWRWSTNPDVAIVILIVIEGTGCCLQAVKSYRQPSTEAYGMWLSAGLAGLLGLGAVGLGAHFSLYLYPLLLAVFNLGIAGLIWLGKRRLNDSLSVAPGRISGLAQ